ncbi:hypothetical protein HK105_201728 [Polyrhizophydium stewartii]|uniref:Uncharacterized protein n=1 Tax=Polyrhizophydium stewartii TaxID=2732419 RepID=A0ABR4NH82_9FUNG
MTQARPTLADLDRWLAAIATHPSRPVVISRLTIALGHAANWRLSPDLSVAAKLASLTAARAASDPAPFSAALAAIWRASKAFPPRAAPAARTALLSTVLQGAIASRDKPAIDHAHELCATFFRSQSQSAAFIIYTHAVNEDFAGAQRVLEPILQAKQPLDAGLARAVIVLLARNGLPAEAQSLLAISISRGVRPYDDVYVHVLAGYILTHQYELARMWIVSIPPSSRAFTFAWTIWLQRLFSFAQSADQATPLLDQVLSHPSTSHDDVLFYVALYGLVSSRAIEKAIALLDDMSPRFGVQPLLHHYAIVLAGKIASGALASPSTEIDALLKNIAETPVEPATFGVLIDALLGRDLLAEAGSLYNVMVRPKHEGGADLPPSPGIMYIFLRHAFRTGNKARGFELYKQMLADGGVPNSRVFKILLNLFAGDAEAVMSLWDQTMTHVAAHQSNLERIKLSEIVFEQPADIDMVVEELAPATHSTKHVTDDPLQDDSDPNEPQLALLSSTPVSVSGAFLTSGHYTPVVSTLLAEGNAKEAQALMHDMAQRRLGLTSGMVLAFARYCQKAGDHKAALNMIESARTQGLEPTPSLYASYISSLVALGQLTRAESALLESLRMGLMPTHLAFIALADGYVQAREHSGLCRLWMCAKACDAIDAAARIWKQLRDLWDVHPVRDVADLDALVASVQDDPETAAMVARCGELASQPPPLTRWARGALEVLRAASIKR